MPRASSVVSSFSVAGEYDLLAACARVFERLLPWELNPRGLWVESQCPWCSHDHPKTPIHVPGERATSGNDRHFASGEGKSFFCKTGHTEEKTTV